jgi:hypothetical protein
MQPTRFDKPRLSPTEVRDYCGNIFSNYSLRRSRSTGLLLGLPSPEYLRIGNRICYEKSVIDAWVDKHASRQSSTAQNSAA